MPSKRPHAWFAAAAVLYSCWLLELVLPVGLSSVDSYVSELLAADQPYRLLFRGTDLMAAGCLVVATRRSHGRLASFSLLFFAAATIADTVLALDCAPSVDALCRYRESTGDVSLSHRLHQVTSVLTYLGALATAAAFARRWQARVVLALLVVTGVLSLALANDPGAGLVQRAQLLVIAAGLVCLSCVDPPADRRGHLQPGGGSFRTSGGWRRRKGLVRLGNSTHRATGDLSCSIGC